MHQYFTNRLINETSPYLLQHAHNPVNWFAWGEEALSKAKAENKVILISIGYSACHWCHVMERESFENESVALVMNEQFINIKIDREERPDLDHIYMDAVQAMTGSGGWPLNVFLTPDAKPFYGGTYFPPVKAFNRASWMEILQGIANAWKERNIEIEAQAENLTNHLKNANVFAQFNNTIPTDEPEQLFTAEQCQAMFSAIMKTADTKWGGFGKAPKFPQTFTIQYLLQFHYFTGNEEALKQALLSLDKMIMGGIYDQVGGGFARYSTDEEWLAPHFEKMLYDNALLISVLCDAYQLSGAKKYEAVIRKTISFVSNELMSNGSGFYAALDADSEGEEGKYYVWQKNETDQLLGAAAALFNEFFDVTETGNWEGKNILRTLTAAADFVKDKGLGEEQFLQTMDQCLQKLAASRKMRVMPPLDDKIILGWNALMLKALAKAAIVLQDKRYSKMAEENLDFLTKNFKTGISSAALMHTYKNGTARYPAFLDDYAYLVDALLQLYKATFNAGYLQMALDYCNYVIEHFSDEQSVFFYFTSQEQKDIIVRKKEIYDGATPSGNAVMAGNLYQLAVIFDKSLWRERADKMMKTLEPSVLKYPASFGIWAAARLQQVAGLNEVAIIGPNFAAIASKILLKFIPNMILMAATGENNDYPMLAGKLAGTDSSIFLCRNYSCLAPFSDVESLLTQIEQVNKL